MKELLNRKRDRFRQLVESGVTSKTQLAMKLAVSVRVVELWLKEDFNKGELPEEVAQQTGRKLKKEQESESRIRRERRRARFRHLYLSRKHTNEHIAKKLGIARTTLHSWIRAEFPEGARWRYNAFVFLYESGRFSLESIAYMLHCVRPTVIRYLARYQKEREKAAE